MVRLVRTVYPAKEFNLLVISRRFIGAALAAARIISVPPLACTSTRNTPRRAADLIALATVFGMSWYFRSRDAAALDHLYDRGLRWYTAPSRP